MKEPTEIKRTIRKIGKFNIIKEDICDLPCDCGWNISIGGELEEDLKNLKEYLEKQV
jgi:hypothetical protein